ncbi:hypothetical protein NFC81_12905 [Salinispirillum sp. LH 10-3-1]|uniref:Uncharacterized protein n=1 Tax=Salinispirillum sp. LH 10-3-1 TaxID=2952525 RepID=A0AB38YE72_9GAMM
MVAITHWTIHGSSAQLMIVQASQSNALRAYTGLHPAGPPLPSVILNLLLRP